MTALVLDAGALIGVERSQVDVLRRLEAAQRYGVDLRTSAIVLGQVWRSGAGRQTLIARLLPAIGVVPVDTQAGQAAGLLTARAHTSDPIDAALVLTADSGDTILTSDPGDIQHLVDVAERSVAVVRC